MFTLSSTDNRCKNLNLSFFRKCHNNINHLVNCLFVDFASTFWTMRNTNSCIEKSEIIIYFCNSSYCRTRISVSWLLVYRYSRWKSFNTVNIRLFHLSQELSCIWGQWFHISSLTFCIYCIKCKTRLSRTWKSCKHNKLVSWNINIYSFKIMLSCTLYPYAVPVTASFYLFL